MKQYYKDYKSYIRIQRSKSKRTIGRTIRSTGKREFVSNKMSDLGINRNSYPKILCVGARHDSEIEHFEEKGFIVKGIDLYNSSKIIKCDMSIMHKHHLIQNERFNIVLSIDSLEHCFDLNGLVEGLNLVCLNFFICLCPLISDANNWDCSVHEFMNSEGIELSLEKSFYGFKVKYIQRLRGRKIFFVLEKKDSIL